MKKKIYGGLFALALLLTACSSDNNTNNTDSVAIHLSDSGITINGEAADYDNTKPVYIANDIIYYQESQPDGYGAGSEKDEHSAQEAEKHTVVHICAAGDYVISGSIERGQIAVDLGRDAKQDPNAVVNLTLNNANIKCTVAPAIICYNAYECEQETSSPSKDVDTSDAGFNIIIADDSQNNIEGSYVAKIYKEGTEKKLHKYDAAVESLVSMNIKGTDGTLNIKAENEGIETKMHITIDGGNININAGDDAINASEDGVSVITVNGGRVLANAGGGDEGDGIDSNGWIVINGGYVSAFANSNSMDSGVDSDNGIYINGGTLLASGNMYDEISDDSLQNFVVFSFQNKVTSEENVILRSSQGEDVVGFNCANDYTVLVYSSPLFADDDYTMYKTDYIEGELLNGLYCNITDSGDVTQLVYSDKNIGGRLDMSEQPPEKPDGDEMPDWENGRQPPEKPDMDFDDKFKDDKGAPPDNGLSDVQKPPMEKPFEDMFDQTSDERRYESIFSVNKNNRKFSRITQSK